MLQCDAQVSDENPPRHARRFLLLLQEDDANEKRMFSILKRWKTVLDADALGLFFVCLLVCLFAVVVSCAHILATSRVLNKRWPLNHHHGMDSLGQRDAD